MKSPDLVSCKHRSNARVVRCKMAGFKVKRAAHRDWPQPTLNHPGSTGHNGFAWLTRISSGVGRAGRTSIPGAGRWVLLHPVLAALGHDRRLNSLISGGPGTGQRRGNVTTSEE
jgi:hypothetical protein